MGLSVKGDFLEILSAEPSAAPSTLHLTNRGLAGQGGEHHQAYSEVAGLFHWAITGKEPFIEKKIKDEYTSRI